MIFRPQSQLNRPGVACLWAVAVFAILTIVMAAVFAQIMMARKAVDHRRDQMQSLWLARSGVEVAAIHLLDQPSGYTGETISPIPESEVRITVRSETPDTFLVNVDARYPVHQRVPVLHRIERRVHRTGAKDHPRLEISPVENAD